MAVIRLSESVIFYCYAEKVAQGINTKKNTIRRLENEPYRIHAVFVVCNLLRAAVLVFLIL